MIYKHEGTFLYCFGKNWEAFSLFVLSSSSVSIIHNHKLHPGTIRVRGDVHRYQVEVQVRRLRLLFKISRRNSVGTWRNPTYPAPKTKANLDRVGSVFSAPIVTKIAISTRPTGAVRPNNPLTTANEFCIPGCVLVLVSKAYGGDTTGRPILRSCVPITCDLYFQLAK